MGCLCCFQEHRSTPGRVEALPVLAEGALPPLVYQLRHANSPTPAQPLQSRALFGIWLKVLSVAVFLVMATLLKAAEGIPAGEMVFFRSLFAIFPIVAFLAWRGELIEGAKTRRPGGH